MGMTPSEFFEAFVHGNYEDCEQYPGCVRRAFNAAVSASHLADHYFAYYRKHNKSKVKPFNSIGDFVEYLSNKTDGCFRDIRSISNAYKHLYTSADPSKAMHSSISSTGAIESIDFEYSNGKIRKVEEHWDEESGDRIFESKVVFTRKDDKRIEFLLTLKAVVKFWDKLLYGGQWGQPLT
jgi:hypothetical protein